MEIKWHYNYHFSKWWWKEYRELGRYKQHNPSTLTIKTNTETRDWLWIVFDVNYTTFDVPVLLPLLQMLDFCIHHVMWHYKQFWWFDLNWGWVGEGGWVRKIFYFPVWKHKLSVVNSKLGLTGIVGDVGEFHYLYHFIHYVFHIKMDKHKHWPVIKCSFQWTTSRQFTAAININLRNCIIVNYSKHALNTLHKDGLHTSKISKWTAIKKDTCNMYRTW